MAAGRLGENKQQVTAVLDFRGKGGLAAPHALSGPHTIPAAAAASVFWMKACVRAASACTLTVGAGAGAGTGTALAGARLRQHVVAGVEPSAGRGRGAVVCG